MVQIEGRIKGVIIKREKSGKWYAIVQVKDDAKPEPPTGKCIGIDVGIRYFLTDSEGRQIENPRFYERTLKRIRILHRNLSKKRKGSENREKARIKLAKAYEKLVNQRNDFLHKLSRFYIDNYDAVVVEDLQIGNMVKNHNLAQKILDASWGKFIQLLSYKAERAGRRVVKVSPRGTSQENREKIKDRDYRAAVNILNRGLSGLGRSLVPVEEKPLRRITASTVITGQVSPMKQEAPQTRGSSRQIAQWHRSEQRIIE